MVKTTKPRSQPSCMPTELQVAARPRLAGRSMVSDQPSTATSWVAVSRLRRKNMTVRAVMERPPAPPPSPSQVSR